jgi:hypothetical protein
MFINAFTQMAALVIGTASLAHIDPKIAMGAGCGRLAMMYAFKLARRDLSYYPPIRGLTGVVIAATFARPAVMLVSDLGLFAYARHPYEMGCVQWWFGRLWPWLLLVAAIVLRATSPAGSGNTTLNTTHGWPSASTSADLGANATAAMLNATPSIMASNATVVAGEYAQSALTDPAVLSAVASTLLLLWLLSFVAFFRLAKRGCWPSFWNNETAAEYTKRVKWDAQPDEKRRAMLLVRVHPSLLRLVAPEARIWIHSNWARWLKDPPEWFTDRWKRGLPSMVLSREALKELGGKNRRRSTLSEQLRPWVKGERPPSAGPTDAPAAPSESAGSASRVRSLGGGN